VLSNYGGTRSAIDSALTQAYRYRDHLPALERDRVVARYFALGPGRDRAKGIGAYESILQHVLVNLAEMFRTRRDFARAESLNVLGDRVDPTAGRLAWERFRRGIPRTSGFTCCTRGIRTPRCAHSPTVWFATARG
jgi:hypothetical protein